MPAPGEHRTVQTRILAYAEEVGWIPVGGIPREEAERRRGWVRERGLCFGISVSHSSSPRHQPIKGDRKVPSLLSIFFDDLLNARSAGSNPDRNPDNVSDFSHNLNRLFQNHQETHLLS